jgi:hypothetical protein
MSKNGSKSRALHNKSDGKTRVPWCTDFGDSKEERKKKFPDAKFCSKCEDWENEGPNTRSKQTSRRFACQANFGPNWFAPTSLKADWCRNTVRPRVGPNSMEKKRSNEGEPILSPPRRRQRSSPKKENTD